MTSTAENIPTNAKPKLQQSVASVFGEVVWLLSQSEDYKDMTLRQLEVAVMSPVLLKQFRLFRENNMPAALATWAEASAEAKHRIEHDRKSMTPKDWKSGEEILIVDLVAPFGAKEAIEKEVKKHLGLEK